MYTSACPYPICPSSSYAPDPARIPTLGASEDDVRRALLRPPASIATRTTRRCRPTSGSPDVDHRVKGKRHGH